MTLLQTRVEDRIARQFQRAAKERGLSPYSLLKELVTKTAACGKENPWAGHWERIQKLNLKPLSYNPVVRDREESDAR
jgi:hypothetical protein